TRSLRPSGSGQWSSACRATTARSSPMARRAPAKPSPCKAPTINSPGPPMSCAASSRAASNTCFRASLRKSSVPMGASNICAAHHTLRSTTRLYTICWTRSCV
ncbi:hypothetical protein EC988_010443, partial [Linderina pennispora]